MASSSSDSVATWTLVCMAVILSAGTLMLRRQANATERLNDQIENLSTDQGVRIDQGIRILANGLDRISDRLDRPSGDCPWCGQRFMWSESAKEYLKVYDLTSYHMKAALDQVTTTLSRLQDFIKENEETK